VIGKNTGSRKLFESKPAADCIPKIEDHERALLAKV
jgi:hypothetical protein